MSAFTLVIYRRTFMSYFPFLYMTLLFFVVGLFQIVLFLRVYQVFFPGPCNLTFPLHPISVAVLNPQTVVQISVCCVRDKTVQYDMRTEKTGSFYSYGKNHCDLLSVAFFNSTYLGLSQTLDLIAIPVTLQASE